MYCDIQQRSLSNMIKPERIKCVPMVVDRGLSRYLDIVSFVSFRRTCRCHYNDSEAWLVRSKNLPIRIASLNPREIIALHHLLEWSMQLTYQIGTNIWYQKIVDWLEYNTSIRIMSLFFIQMNCIDLDLRHVSVRKRYLWLKQTHLYQSQRVYKIENITDYKNNYEEYLHSYGYDYEYGQYNEEYNNIEYRPSKRRKRWVQSIRTPQSCC